MNKEKEFLIESNAIEGEYSSEALEDAERAWFYCINASRPLKMRTMLTIHRLLLEHLNPKIAGKLRKCNVYVGERMCAPHQDVELLLYRWFDKWEYAYGKKNIKKAHIEFEKIHPFEDGNGRIGRIIMNMQRLTQGLPLLIIHQGEEQMEYYKWFKN